MTTPPLRHYYFKSGTVAVTKRTAFYSIDELFVLNLQTSKTQTKLKDLRFVLSHAIHMKVLYKYIYEGKKKEIL